MRTSPCLFQTVGGNSGGDKQSYVIPISAGRYKSVMWERGKGVTKECPHRHTSIDRAVQCAKDLLSANTLLRVMRTQ